MTPNDHQKIAKIIAVSPITNVCKRRLIATFCAQLAGDSLHFDVDLFVITASNGRWRGIQALARDEAIKGIT